MIDGKVGSKKLTWLNAPKGKSGEAKVSIDGREENVRWIRDDQGIWLQTSKGFFGFDARRTENDDGAAQYELLRRRQAEVYSGVAFLKAGEEGDASGAQKVKKGVKVKSQMPGKILRMLVKPGDEVKKGQAIIVMEAMKMENEIKSTQDGTIKDVKVKEGQAVETGAELLNFN